jgi:hypothetical protein
MMNLLLGTRMEVGGPIENRRVYYSDHLLAYYRSITKENKVQLLRAHFHLLQLDDMEGIWPLVVPGKAEVAPPGLAAI